MKKLIAIIGISVFIISLNACKKTDADKTSSDVNNVIEEKDWEKLDKSEYSIQYPKDWTLDISGTGGTVFMMTSKLDSDTDQVTQNVNGVIENLPEKIDLDAYAKAALDQIKTVYPTILEKEKVKSENGDFYKVIFSGQQNGMELKLEQHYRIKNNKAYVITFTSSIDDFDKDKEIGEKIMSSFNLK